LVKSVDESTQHYTTVLLGI